MMTKINRRTTEMPPMMKMMMMMTARMHPIMQPMMMMMTNLNRRTTRMPPMISETPNKADRPESQSWLVSNLKMLSSIKGRLVDACRHSRLLLHRYIHRQKSCMMHDAGFTSRRSTWTGFGKQIIKPSVAELAVSG